jgi:hypothetical protein
VEKSPELTAPGPTRRWWTYAALLAVALVVAVGAWFVTDALRSDSNDASVDAVGPIGLTQDGLRVLATSVGQPVYWAGPQQGYVYEVTRNAKAHVLVRYLPPGVDVGAPDDGAYLVVATYPYRNAYNALAHVSDGQKYDIPRGGIALVDARTANSVHVAYPHLNWQVEIYDPSPERALGVARSGAVRVIR